ncbi:hypothetical protein S40293_09644 [Stachybotrys chartarum IBT 40293]|nr:hypothetical protein S40293_09644 [Stachybotrys chartarum IBT 40293]
MKACGHLGLAEVFDAEATQSSPKRPASTVSGQMIVVCCTSIISLRQNASTASPPPPNTSLLNSEPAHGAMNIRWVPDHTKIIGNEEADALAKAGCLKPVPEGALSHHECFVELHCLAASADLAVRVDTPHNSFPVPSTGARTDSEKADCGGAVFRPTLRVIFLSDSVESRGRISGAISDRSFNEWNGRATNGVFLAIHAVYTPIDQYRRADRQKGDLELVLPSMYHSPTQYVNMGEIPTGHTKPQKEMVRKRTESGMNKATETGVLCNTFTAYVFWNPTYKELQRAGHLPEGMDVPEVTEFLREMFLRGDARARQSKKRRQNVQRRGVRKAQKLTTASVESVDEIHQDNGSDTGGINANRQAPILSQSDAGFCVSGVSSGDNTDSTDNNMLDIEAEEHLWAGVPAGGQQIVSTLAHVEPRMNKRPREAKVGSEMISDWNMVDASGDEVETNNDATFQAVQTAPSYPKKACKHTHWLRVSRKDQAFALEVSDRAQKLLDSLPKPDKQSPSLILLVGNQSKLRLLQKLGISATGPRGNRGHGEVHMSVVPSTARSNSPILIADGDVPVHNRLGGPWKTPPCHEISVRPFDASLVQRKAVGAADHVYHRVVLPFVDVVCLFATDLGGTERAASHLARWMKQGQPSTSEILPWLIIVIDDGNEIEELAAFLDLMRSMADIDLTERFGGIRVVCLAFTKLVEAELKDKFVQYLTNGSSRDLHQRVMLGFRQEWASLYSDDTCFCCLRRRPQFGLSCGHSLCENCVRVFGRENMSDPWVFHIERCLLCDAETQQVVQIKVKPDTASVRVLSIDGGGTRGRAPLEFVQVLQNRLGLPCPVQHHFDMVYGTSSGAIIAYALFINGWPVEDCIASFESLARLAFKPRSLHGIPFLSKICNFILSFLVDSRYPSKNLDAALSMAFGSTRNIMECSEASKTGTMVGVPVTTIRDVSPCIFTNYNGVGKREGSSDYYVLPSEAAGRRIPLREILQCATAAPYYFKPCHINGLGTFQDGGLMYNNPASIALQEVAALFPNTPEPSLVVSLGTGSARVERPDTSTPRSFWRDSFCLRVFRAFCQYGNSRRAWQQLLSHHKLGKTGEYFRFDVEFEGPEPSLDDVSVMEEIGEIARETMLDSPALDSLVLRMRAELFVFELDPERSIEFVNGMYECVGKIFCRLRANTPAFDAFMTQLDQSSATFLIDGTELPGNFHDCVARLSDGNFCKDIRFRTSSRLNPIAISLREDSTPCFISGAPFTLQRLVEAQKLGARFGTSDHRKRKWHVEEAREVRESQRKRSRRD